MEFSEINNGKRISLNKKDIWSYESIADDLLVKFSINHSNNNISYKVSLSNDDEIKDYTDYLL